MLLETENNIPVYYGDDLLYLHGRNMAYESKIMICPHCLERRQFIKESPDDIFHFDSNHDPFECDTREIKIFNEPDFRHHMNCCQYENKFDGIQKAVSKKLLNIGHKMNAISKMETGYSRISIQESTYLFFFQGDPISYIAYDPSFTCFNDGDWLLIDVYTIPKFRRKKYASQLFEYAIKDLHLDVDKLWISFPISDLGKPLILKYAKKTIFAMSIVYRTLYDVDYLEENWDKIMKLY